jgi:hypothetical protein
MVVMKSIQKPSSNEESGISRNTRMGPMRVDETLACQLSSTPIDLDLVQMLV